MQILSKNLKVRLYSTFILTVLAIVLLTIALLTSFDNSTGYFETSLLYSVARSLGIVTAALAVISFFATPKGELSGDSPLTFPVIFPSAFMAIVLFAVFIILIGCSIFNAAPILKLFTGFAASSDTLMVIAAVAAFFASVYFLLNCFTQDGKQKQFHTLIGFALPVAAVFLIAVSYFDLTVSMNAPVKSFSHLSLIFFTLWSGYELRSMLNKAMPRLYFSFGLITVFFSGVASLPWIIGYLAGAISGPAYPTYILYNLISLAIFAYTAVRLTVFVFARDIYERIADQTPPEDLEEAVDKEPDPADEIEADSETPEDDVKTED